jgi:hypothetical protein
MRVQTDMARAGWGCPGGGGARERKWARLGTKRDAEREMRVLAWSERQRGSEELEVSCLGLCPERGHWRGLGFTQGADRWGCRVGWVQILAWQVVERKERGGRGYWQDLACMGSGLLFSFFVFEHFEQLRGWGGARCSVGYLAGHGC